MKRLVLLLLAAIPIVILFVLAPWEDAAQGTALTDDPRMVDREDIPAAELGSNADPKADLIADETPGGEGAERRSLSDDHIQVSGQLVDRRGRVPVANPW